MRKIKSNRKRVAETAAKTRSRIAAAKLAWKTIRAKEAARKAWKTIRVKDKRYQSGSYYASALEKAWKKLISRVKSNRLNPVCEEAIQCSLFQGLEETLKTAADVHPKATKGGLKEKDMIFPDFSVGPDVKAPKVVVEIKFSRRKQNRRISIMAGCCKDIEKMLKYYPDAVRYMVIFQQLPGEEEGDQDISLDEERLNALKRLDGKCKILYYPTRFTKDPKTLAALKAWSRHFEPKAA